MRVILDTNILISGLISPSGKPARLIDAWLDGRFTLVSHAVQLEEFRAVSRRQRIRPLLRASEAGRLVNRIAAMVDLTVIRGGLVLADASAAPVVVDVVLRDGVIESLAPAGSMTNANARIVTAAQFASELDV